MQWMLGRKVSHDLRSESTATQPLCQRLGSFVSCRPVIINESLEQLSPRGVGIHDQTANARFISRPIFVSSSARSPAYFAR